MRRSMPAQGDTPREQAAYVSRGTTVPLAPIDNHFPQWLGINHVDNFLLESHMSTYTWEYQLVHLLSFDVKLLEGCDRSNTPLTKYLRAHEDCAAFMFVLAHKHLPAMHRPQKCSHVTHTWASPTLKELN